MGERAHVEAPWDAQSDCPGPQAKQTKILTLFVELESSVADPGCLSRIPDPDFYSSRIPDLESRIPDLGSRIQKQHQKREVKKN